MKPSYRFVAADIAPDLKARLVLLEVTRNARDGHAARYRRAFWVRKNLQSPHATLADMYCYSCGAVLDRLPPTVCKSCGVHHWNDAKPTGVALVHHEGRLLLIRRAVEPWRGRWDFPGGFCNDTEHPISAAEREVFEETEIQIRVTGYLGAWYESHDDPELPQGVLKTTLGFFFHAVPTADTRPQPSHEATDGRWFLPDDIPEDIAFPEQQLPALRAWKQAIAEGRTITPLPDRPPT